MSRIQSSNVADNIREYLKAIPPKGMNVVPLILPVMEAPFPEYWMFCWKGVSLAADFAHVVCTVPDSEDWLLKALTVRTSLGDGTFDYIHLYYPADRDVSGLPRHVMQFGAASGSDYVSISDVADATSFTDNNLSIPMYQATYITVGFDFKTTNTNLWVSGVFIRRKW